MLTSWEGFCKIPIGFKSLVGCKDHRGLILIFSCKSKKAKAESKVIEESVKEEIHDEEKAKKRKKKRTKVAPHARAAVEEKLKILMSAT